MDPSIRAARSPRPSNTSAPRKAGCAFLCPDLKGRSPPAASSALRTQSSGRRPYATRESDRRSGALSGLGSSTSSARSRVRWPPANNRSKTSTPSTCNSDASCHTASSIRACGSGTTAASGTSGGDCPSPNSPINKRAAASCSFSSSESRPRCTARRTCAGSTRSRKYSRNELPRLPPIPGVRNPPLRPARRR